jgi:hypothetical protein
VSRLGEQAEKTGGCRLYLLLSFFCVFSFLASALAISWSRVAASASAAALEWGTVAMSKGKDVSGPASRSSCEASASLSACSCASAALACLSCDCCTSDCGCCRG